ncbi:CPBP family intramembrane glutamic endopeptidase [Paludisphaera mucosa]|uniref:CPBP family intramembrane metalloprotease n=1 Tax=Paludisphaera mucosa TaxID=3030827 RepID=A0ABT6FHW0_9BACT|nr:CPBP family intramembrane glutamic endopeptidase [Paludisphaera mucosa]MDG3007134.1 CPBP family intramembrane metalloprotease [Paludisphaera mucosa]
MQDRNDLSDSGELPGPDVEAPGHDAMMTLAVLFEGGLAPMSLVAGWLFGHPPLRHFGWDVDAALLGAAAALPPALLVIAMLHRPFPLFAGLRRTLDEEIVPLVDNCTWKDLVLIAVAMGVGQEMFFRGVLQPAISEMLGDAWGVALTSLLFGVLQPISVAFAFIGFLLGVYLGTLCLLTGNLLAAITCNGLYYFALLAYTVRPDDVDRLRENPIQPVPPDRSIDDPDAR